MIDSSDLRSYIAVFIVSALSIIQGLRMLVKPTSIRENSLMYQYMLQRFFRYLDKEVQRTEKLTHKHIQIYGVSLILLGMLFLGIVLIVF
jgi:hypothetical protein